MSAMLWGTLLVVGVLGYLNHKPIRLSNQNLVAHGSADLPHHTSDILVVLWTDEITRSAESGRFDEVDWSWVWVDLLASEIGPVRVCEAEDFGDPVIGDARYLIITHSAAVHPQVDDAVHLLERFVNHGGVLLLERPEGSLRSAFSADGRGGMRTPTAITHVAHMPEDLASALCELPLFTRFIGSTGPLDGADTLMAMDGAPVVYRVSRADGAAVTVDFNFPLALLSLQQGRPDNPQFAVTNPDGDGGPFVSDLVADDRLRDAHIPYADLLEHFMIQVALASDAPLPGFWYFPGGASGALLLSHNTVALGDRAVWLAEYEAQQQSGSTFFFSFRAIPTAQELSRYDQTFGEPAILWERGSASHYDNRRRIGLGGVRPFYREVTLADQVGRIRRELSRADPAIGVRIRDGIWTSHYTETFRMMAAARVRYDSSYGPHGNDGQAIPAYRYGTGRPFRVYDTNGLPFDLYEVPFVLDSMADADQIERLENLLFDSQRGFHQSISVNLDSHFLTTTNGLAAFDAWQHLIVRAGQRQHLVMSIQRLIDFAQARTDSSLTSRLTEIPSTRDRDAEGFLLSLTLEASADGLWLRVPRTISEHRFRSASGFRQPPGSQETGEELEARNDEVFGQEVTLVSLPSSVRRVEVTYR